MVLGGSVGGWVGEYVLVRVCLCVLCCVLCCVVVCLSGCVLCVVSRKIKWSSTASSGKANDQRIRERVVLDLFSNFKWVRSKSFFGEPLKHVITLRGPFMVIRKLTMTPCHPCVDSKRPRVYRHHAHMFQHVHTETLTTCGRGAGTHGDVLNLHTEAF